MLHIPPYGFYIWLQLMLEIIICLLVALFIYMIKVDSFALNISIFTLLYA